MLSFWTIIEKSKKGKPYLNDEEQCESLFNILVKMPKKDVQLLEAQWGRLRNELMFDVSFLLLILKLKGNPENKFFHDHFGGFEISNYREKVLEKGVHYRYLYNFANWIIAQGEELYNALIGNEAVKNMTKYVKFIKEAKISISSECGEPFDFIFSDAYSYINNVKSNKKRKTAEYKKEDIREMAIYIDNYKNIKLSDVCFEDNAVAMIEDLYNSLSEEAKLCVFKEIDNNIKESYSRFILDIK